MPTNQEMNKHKLRVRFHLVKKNLQHDHWSFKMESYDYSPSQNKYFLLFNLHLQWVFISLIFTVNDDHVNEHDDHFVEEVAPFYGVKVLSHNLKSFRLFSVSLDFRCSFIREIWNVQWKMLANYNSWCSLFVFLTFITSTQT